MQHLPPMQKLTRIAFLCMIALVILTATVWGIRLFALSHHQTATPTPNVTDVAIGGFPMSGELAPDFTLTDQFGQSVTLSSLHGHEVVIVDHSTHGVRILVH